MPPPFSAVAGHWSGAVRQPGLSYQADVMIDGRAGLGTHMASVQYTGSVRCSGYWIGESVRGDTYTVSEHITASQTPCVDDDIVFTFSPSPRRLDLDYYLQGALIGSATLFQ